MQEKVYVAQAFGMIGEMYDTTPRRVDGFELATDISIGDPVCRKSDGTLGAYAAGSFTEFVGICVRAKEQVNYGATTALSPSLVVKAGVTAEVASMGRIIVPLKLTATGTASGAAKTALEALVVGDYAKLYFKDGILTTTSTGATEIGRVVKGAKGTDAYGVTETGSGTSYTATGYVNVVIEIGC